MHNSIEFQSSIPVHRLVRAITTTQLKKTTTIFKSSLEFDRHSNNCGKYFLLTVGSFCLVICSSQFITKDHSVKQTLMPTNFSKAFDECQNLPNLLFHKALQIKLTTAAKLRFFIINYFLGVVIFSKVRATGCLKKGWTRQDLSSRFQRQLN